MVRHQECPPAAMASITAPAPHHQPADGGHSVERGAIYGPFAPSLTGSHRVILGMGIAGKSWQSHPEPRSSHPRRP
jgi:hypothetical protein